MSAGLLQTLHGSHDMGGSNALSSEPWLLPITDRAPRATDGDAGLAEAVRRAARGPRIAVNTLCAVLALLLTAHVATDWTSAVNRPGTGQIADASPPSLAAEKAALSVSH